MSLSSDLFRLHEPYAGGFLENPERSRFYRHANAQYRFWEQAELTPYDGGRLYPCGWHPAYSEANGGWAMRPSFSYTYDLDLSRMQEKSPQAYELLAAEHGLVTWFDKTPHTVGGAGYTHSHINYKRILSEGLREYRRRVEALPEDDFRAGLLRILDGIELFRQRCLSLLREANADKALIEALEYVPENPPRSLYEALVAWNFVYYIDGCDDIGALDRHLPAYVNGEDLDEITALIHELFKHVDDNNGWSGVLGPNYNEITVACLRAIRGGRKPNLQLLVKPDMPKEIWDEVLASLCTGCGQPALHNADLFSGKLHELFPEIPQEDLDRIAFGGCTETMLEGISNVGSDDAGINHALIFDRWMRKGLADCATFEEFRDGYIREMRAAVAETLDILNDYRRTRAQYRPHPIRTLLIEDCIDKRRDFNDDGARWIWSCVNLSGFINVIDAMNTVRTLVYNEKLYSAEDFIAKLDAQDPAFVKEMNRCPRYGVDNEAADDLATFLGNAAADALEQRECYPRGRFVHVANQFTTYVDAGLGIGATPDGRCCAAPLCDSLGAIHGNDTEGPTALLNSVTKLPLSRYVGTPVVNIRIKKDHMTILPPLVAAYFDQGGMQLQVSCLSREDMIAAMNDPEKHRNLVVRIGGYSEYFTRLSPEMQKTVLARTEY